MKFALLGVGGAGGRIVNALAKIEANSDRTFSRDQFLVFDTTKAAFEEFTEVPPNKHVLVGDTHPDIRGEGLDGDVDLGAAVAEEDTDEIFREFDKLATHEVHATVFVAGLAGGTGGGVGPVILKGLQSVTENPVYVLGILPADCEGDQAASNAARALRSYVELADNTILFDNDAWFDEEADGDLEETYQRLNVELVTRIIAVLAAGELEDAPIAENRMDASDIMRTLEPGGVSTLGYATTELDRPSGLLERLLAVLKRDDDEEPVTDATQIQELIQSTVRQKLTVPCQLDSTERGLLVLSGPRDVCSRKGFETGRYWLEQETDTVDVRAGDEPKDGSLISASVLLTNVTDVPRIEELQRRAVAYKRKQDGPDPEEDQSQPEIKEEVGKEAAIEGQPDESATTADPAPERQQSASGRETDESPTPPQANPNKEDSTDKTETGVASDKQDTPSEPNRQVESEHPDSRPQSHETQGNGSDPVSRSPDRSDDGRTAQGDAGRDIPREATETDTGVNEGSEIQERDSGTDEDVTPGTDEDAKVGTEETIQDSE